MSLFKSLAKGISKVGSAISKAGPLASFIPGASLLAQAGQYASLVPQNRSSAPQQEIVFGGGPSARSLAPRAQTAAYSPMASMGSLPAIGGAVSAMGRRVNWGRIWNAVKVLGIAATASALNMEVGQLAAELLQHPRKRRRKGITARQLSNARRVNRIVGNWSKQLHLHRSAPRKSCR